MPSSQAVIPLFALPGVVLFPHVYMPFHIFEPRYRQMVRDAVAADGMIGIVSYDLGAGDDYDDADRLLTTGGLGVLERVEPLPDGRFNILLRGVRRFAIDELVPGKPYRRGQVRFLDEALRISPAEARRGVADLRALFRYLNPAYEQLAEGIIGTQRAELAYAALINNLITVLDMAFADKQTLLEVDGVQARMAILAPYLDEHLTRSRLVQELLARREEFSRQHPGLN